MENLGIEVQFDGFVVSKKFTERRNKAFVRFVFLLSKNIKLVQTCIFDSSGCKVALLPILFMVFIRRIFQPFFKAIVFHFDHVFQLIGHPLRFAVISQGS